MRFKENKDWSFNNCSCNTTNNVLRQFLFNGKIYIIVTTRFFMFLDIITFIFTVFIFNNLVFILTKSHLGSYPCPLNINFYWNMGFTLGIVIVVQIVTGLFISFHYSSDINEAYYSVFFLIREIYYGWSLRFLHSSGASFVFLFVFLHIGRSLFYGSFFYNPNTWFSGILILLLLMGIAFLGYVLPFGQMSFWGATVITNLLSPFPCLIEWVCGGYCVNSPTLKRFFVFHFVFPHVTVGTLVLHIYFLHFHCSNNPSRTITNNRISFFPFICITNYALITGDSIHG